MAIGVGATLNGRFLLEKELGRGGMGAVYAARDQLLERKVAIKVLKDQSGEEVGRKLRLEAQIAARLLHENVVRIYDFGQSDGVYYLVMEEVDGPSFTKRWRQIPLDERLLILAEVAEALDYAHHQGVVHRDVKPGNVLLTAGDTPKLSDFGLSMVIERGDDSGVIRGTPHYMSPEQTRAARLDYRTDLYSLGVMIYEAATGAVPFSGTSVSIMTQHATVEPDRPRERNPQISAELEALILALLSKRPEARPGSGAAVAAALREEVDRMRGRRPAASEAAVPSATEPQAGLAGLLDEAESERNGDRATIAASRASRPTIAAARPLVPAVQLATVAGTGGALALIRSPLPRKMLELVLGEPMMLSPDERYLHGHYLAYLLSGSRRQGLFLRRPMDARNADRARVLLAVTYAALAEASDHAIKDAATLLDECIDVRPYLSPVVSAKYLLCRSSVGRRKLFRQTRKLIAEASAYAQKKLVDPRGILNPGLLPQKIDDLRLLAPERDAVDDVLVERWNRVADVWRDQPAFRDAVLRYATTRAHKDPASAALWPEVVYPLIERARWHRRIRSRTEVLWNYIWGKMLHLPDAGVVLDRALARAVPAPLVEQLDESLELMIEQPPIDDGGVDPFEKGPEESEPTGRTLTINPDKLAEIADEAAPERETGLVPLIDPEPLRFTQGELHELWKEAVQALQSQGVPRPGSRPASHRNVPVGPYRLVVVPSIRGRAAGQVVFQGMRNKQIELTTPPIRTKGSSGKPLIAVWIYAENSLVIAHLDFMNDDRFILWHAPRAHQLNFTDPADLNHELFTLGLEVPDSLSRALARR